MDTLGIVCIADIQTVLFCVVIYNYFFSKLVNVEWLAQKKYY
jgi:hypothetical protein